MSGAPPLLLHLAEDDGDRLLKSLDANIYLVERALRLNMAAAGKDVRHTRQMLADLRALYALIARRMDECCPGWRDRGA